MNLSVNLKGISLEHRIIPAAGWCKDKAHAIELARSAAAAVMVGSITVEARTGNGGEVYYPVQNKFALNSLGLPNHGADYYADALIEIGMSLHHDLGDKPLFASIAGFNPSEYATLAKVILGKVDLVELNLGCPNIWDGGTQKRIACFDPKLVDQILKSVAEVLIENDLSPVVAVKLSPFSDPVLLQEVAAVISANEIVEVVTTMNTFPNAFYFNENGKPAITPGDGLAGLSGAAVKPIGLGQVMQLRACLPDRIAIMGVGGVQSGQDVVDYEQAGALVIQVGTALFNRKPRVFDRILQEYVDLKTA